MTKKSKRLVIVILSAIGGLIAICAAVVAVSLNTGLHLTKPTYIYLPAGSTPETTIERCRQSGMIGGSFVTTQLFKAYGYFSGATIQPGTYLFTGDNSVLDLIKAVYSGKQVHRIKVTLPEGLTYKKIASILQAKAGIDSVEFVRLATSDSLCKSRNIDAQNVEGYLMPDTYFLYWLQPADEVIDRLLNEHLAYWKKAKLYQEGGSIAKHRILTLASIVETETPVASERPRVAGVYTNRLAIGMKLEADPTVQYAIGSKAKLTYTDLKFDSPYNTYRYPGLPPGPICNPGRSCIEAAAAPEKHNYYFFVAKGDGSNTHTFTENARKHQQAVLEYRKLRKLRAGLLD